MNMEIKFRAWDNDDNEMYYPLVLADTDCEHRGFRPLRHCKDGNNAYKDHHIMQFTGLLDIAKKEIYEGDIFRYHSHKGYNLPDFTAEVRWIEQYACFGYCKCGLSLEGWEQPLIHPFAEHDEFTWDMLNFMEVIGNVHDNPEHL